MEKKLKKKFNIDRAITILVVITMAFVFFVMPLQKGGFFKQDLLIFNVCIFLTGILVLVYNIVKKKEMFKFSLIDALILIFAFTFFIPYFIGSSVSVNDALFEAIKYGAFCNIYFLTKFLVKRDSDNNKYINVIMNVIVVATTVVSLLGFDQIGAKFFEGFLGNFDIYYLEEITTRLSSTMQYANGLAVFITIGIFASIYQYFKSNSKKIKALYIVTIFIQLSTIIFSASRGVMAVLAACLIVLLFVLRNKENRYDYLFIGILTIIFSIVFSTIGVRLIAIGQFLLLWFTLAAFTIFIYFTALLYQNIKEKLYGINEKKIWLTSSIVAIVAIIVGIVAINIPDKVIISKKLEDDSVKLVREYSYVKTNTDYNIKFNVSNKTENLDMSVIIFSVDDKGSYTALATKKIDEIEKDNYEVRVKTLDNTKNICFIFNIYEGEGSIELNSISLNGSNKKVNYALLDFDTFHRFDITEFIDQSLNERGYILEDSVKIWLKNPIVGIGGEGFKYKYQEIQSYPYISTETHNYLMELLINTGVLGLLSYVVLIGFTIYIAFGKMIKQKDDVLYRIIFMLFIFLLIHSIIDLDFSFAINIYVFAFVIALLTFNDTNVKKNKDIKIYSRNFYICCGIITNIILFCITMSSLVAYNMKIPIFEDSSLTINNIEKTISKMEERVKLDKYESLYMQRLNKEYTKYKSLLIAGYNKGNNEDKKSISTKVNDLLPKIKTNIDELYKYGEFDNGVIVDVANTYFSNFINFAELDDLKEDRAQYIYKAINIIKDMSKRSPLNITLYEKKAEILYNYYRQLEAYEVKAEEYNKEKILADLKNEIIIIPKDIEESYINKKLTVNQEALKNIYQIIDKIDEKGV